MQKIWLPMYVMKAQIREKIRNRLKENPIKKQNVGYLPIDVHNWQIKELMFIIGNESDNLSS